MLFRLFLVNFKLCFVEIFSNKTRSIITSFGIFLGVASLLGMLSFVRGFRSNTNKQLERMGGIRILTVTNREPERIEEEIAFSRSPGLKLEQLEKAKKVTPNIEKLLPVGSGLDGRMFAAGKRTWGTVMAVSIDHMEERNYEVEFGRALLPSDFFQVRRVGILGSRNAERLFGDTQSALGKRLNVGSFVFTIVGTIKTDDRRDRRSREFLYPYPVYQDLLGGHGKRLSSVDVKVKDVAKIQETRQALTQFLVSEHRGAQDFEVELNTEKLEDQQKANFVVTMLLGAIASISLLVGGVSIANIMFGTIGERIREIGIRKSLGATKSDLFMQFLVEATLLCGIGASFGMLAGATPVLLPEGVFPFEPELLVFDFLLAAGASLSIGILSGLFPALYAAKMEPVDALQYT